ncbi:MAG TPA: sensor histidine kinase [Candidatus Limnocylindrales bacterium]|nr:sensor histidine kinase [Candidatus Limnocylindrales bacterium]
MKANATAKSNISKPSNAIQAAVLEERQRISRELHDRVLQLLSTARLRVERCAQQLSAGPDGLKSDLESVEASLDRAVTEIRNLLSENQLDEQLQAGSLERRLRDELEIFSARTGFKVDFQCSIGAHNLPMPIERELYFTLREGVLNAIRHSRATYMRLSLTQTRTTCEARLSDNGVGFAVSAAEGSSHYGLRGMRERIRKIGGEITFQSAPGKGTEIHVTVPLS